MPTRRPGLATPTPRTTAITLVASCANTLGANGGTSDPLDTTGATVIVVAVSANNPSTLVVTDNRGNAYTGLPARANTSVVHQVFYALNPSVGAGHAVTMAVASSYSSLAVYAFAGVGSYAGLQTGSVSAAMDALAAGTVTPTQPGALVFTTLGSSDTGTDTIPVGFTGGLTAIFYAGWSYQTSAAYQVQATPAPVNPVWSWAPQHYYAVATVAVFNPIPPPAIVTSLLVGGRDTTDDDLAAQSVRLELLLDARGKLMCRLLSPPVAPAMDMSVLFTLEGVPVFGGIIVDLTQTDVGVWSIVAADNAAILDGLFINTSTPATNVKGFLTWMVTTGGLNTYGFSVDPAQADGPAVPALAFPFQSYADAMTQVGTLSGWTLVISPTRALRMYPGGAVPGPWAVDEVTDTIERLTIRQTRQHHATHVYLRFGSGAPSEITWATTANGTATTWVPPYYLATPPGYVTVGGIFLPLDAHPPAGGWTGWTWENLPPGGRLHAPAGVTPGAGTAISLGLVAAWPSVAQAIDVTATTEVSVVLDYPDVFDAATAQTLADGELARRQGYPYAFSLQTSRVGLLPGQTVTVDVPRLDLDTEALVTGVRLAHVTNRGPAGTPWWRYQVDLIEANATRANWLTFWEQTTTGTTGGTGSSVTGTIPPGTPAPPPGSGGGGGTGYATWPLGGDHDAGYSGTAFQPIANACLVVVPAGFTGRTWTVYATCKRLLGTGTFTLALANNAGTNIATSSAVSGDFVSVIFTAPVVPGETYHLRGSTSDVTTLFGTTAYLEAVPV